MSQTVCFNLNCSRTEHEDRNKSSKWALYKLELKDSFQGLVGSFHRGSIQTPGLCLDFPFFLLIFFLFFIQSIQSENKSESTQSQILLLTIPLNCIFPFCSFLICQLASSLNENNLQIATIIYAEVLNCLIGICTKKQAVEHYGKLLCRIIYLTVLNAPAAILIPLRTCTLNQRQFKIFLIVFQDFSRLFKMEIKHGTWECSLILTLGKIWHQIQTLYVSSIAGKLDSNSLFCQQDAAGCSSGLILSGDTWETSLHRRCEWAVRHCFDGRIGVLDYSHGHANTINQLDKKQFFPRRDNFIIQVL